MVSSVMTLIHALTAADIDVDETCQVCEYENKNASRSREASCVSRVPLIRYLHSKHQFLTGDREVVVVMVMLKYAEIILGGILCPQEELVKRQFL